MSILREWLSSQPQAGRTKTSLMGRDSQGLTWSALGWPVCCPPTSGTSLLCCLLSLGPIHRDPRTLLGRTGREVQKISLEGVGRDCFP